MRPDLLQDAKWMAKAELDAEDFRKEVDRQKDRIRRQRKFWHRVFPWTITITINRRD